MPRSLSPESVVAINRNEWSEWTGKGGRLQPESVVAFEWNPQQVLAAALASIRGFHTQLDATTGSI